MGWTWDLNLGLNQRLPVGCPPAPAPPRGACVHTHSSAFPRSACLCAATCDFFESTHRTKRLSMGEGDWSAISLGRLRN